MRDFTTNHTDRAVIAQTLIFSGDNMANHGSKKYNSNGKDYTKKELSYFARLMDELIAKQKELKTYNWRKRVIKYERISDTLKRAVNG